MTDSRIIVRSRKHAAEAPTYMPHGASLDGLRVVSLLRSIFRLCSHFFSRLSVGDRQSPRIYGSPLTVVLFSHQFIIF
jgi:hypothetical protein